MRTARVDVAPYPNSRVAPARVDSGPVHPGIRTATRVVVHDAWKVLPPPGAPLGAGSAEPSRVARRAWNAPAGPGIGDR